MGDLHLTTTFGVYEIRNLVNGKVYIGSTTKSFSHRWKQWHDNLKRGKANRHLQNAWAIYGPENFVFSIVEVVKDKDEVLAREQWWMDYLRPAYNFDKRAQSNRTGTPTSDETKAKISAIHKGKVVSAEIRANMSACKKGKPNGRLGFNHSDETKAKIAASAMGNKRNLGKKRSEETKQKLREANKGQVSWNKGGTISEEQKAAIFATLKGHTVSEETRAKIKAKRALQPKVLGRAISDETREKMRLAKIGKPGNNAGKRHTEEAKAKMRDGHLGKVVSDETRAKLSEMRKGKQFRLGTKQSDAARLKMSESHKALHAEKRQESLHSAEIIV